MIFQIHLPKLTHDIRVAAVLLKVIPRSLAELSEKCLVLSVNTYVNYLVCNDFCVAFHNDKTCFVSNCIFQILLHGKFDGLIKKLDTFCFTYQHVDSLYTLFKYRFSGKVVAKSGQVFDNVQRADYFSYRNKGVDRILGSVKKELLR